MPRGKKRRWKSFVRRVNAVSEKTLGARQVVFNKTDSVINTNSSFHCVRAYYLYGQKSNVDYGNDIQAISQMENESDPTAAAGATVSDSTLYMFQSAVLDMTVVNHSTYWNGSTSAYSTAAKMEVDVYECLVGIPTEETSVTHNTFLDVLNDNKDQTRPIGGTGLEIDYRNRGVTPFELSYSLSRWRVKILKKTKYMLPNGESFTYQVRDPKRHVATNRDLDFKDGFNRPGWTRVIYIVAKIVSGLSVGPANPGEPAYQEVLDVGVTRKYLYKVEGLNDDRTRYLSQ